MVLLNPGKTDMLQVIKGSELNYILSFKNNPKLINMVLGISNPILNKMLRFTVRFVL